MVGLQQTWMCQWSQRARGGGDDTSAVPDRDRERVGGVRIQANDFVSCQVHDKSQLLLSTKAKSYRSVDCRPSTRRHATLASSGTSHTLHQTGEYILTLGDTWIVTLSTKPAYATEHNRTTRVISFPSGNHSIKRARDTELNPVRMSEHYWKT